METIKFSPEDVQKLETLKESAAADVAAFNDSQLKRVLLFSRAKESGAITLDVLLISLAGKSFQDVGRSPDMQALKQLDLEFVEGYRALLFCAKRDILNGKLCVRQLTTLAPVNESLGIQGWCNANDTLKSLEEMRPHGRLVVKLEDAIRWLQEIGVPVPEWLGANCSETVDENGEATGDKQWSDHDTILLTHLRDAIKHWWDGFDPAKDVAPTNDQVRDWLIEHRGVAPRMAASMASMARANGLRSGPRSRAK